MGGRGLGRGMWLGSRLRRLRCKRSRGMGLCRREMGRGEIKGRRGREEVDGGSKGRCVRVGRRWS